MRVKTSITKAEFNILLVFLIVELVFNYTTQFSLYGASALFNHYAIIYMAAFFYNVYFFLKHTIRIIFQEGNWKSLIPIIVMFMYMASFVNDPFSVIWQYASYLLFFINFYGATLFPKYRKATIKILDYLWLIGVFVFIFNTIMAGVGFDNRVTGPTYILLMSFPLLYDKKKSSFIIRMVLLLVVLVLSSKRGPLLIFVLAFVISYLVNSIFNKNERSNIFKIAFTLGTTALMIFALFVVSGLNADQRYLNIRDDGGSGRDIIAEQVLFSYFFSGKHEKIWGHGFNSVIEDDLSHGVSAHNDYLEILYDFGIVGVVMLVVVLISILLHCFSSIKTASFNSNALFFFFVCVLSTCLVTHIFIYPHIYLVVMVVYALLLSNDFLLKGENTVV